MIPKTVHEGDKWAALECIHSGKIEIKEYGEDEDGNKYVTNSYRLNGHTFRCLCGKEFDVAATKFRGKRVIRDCGCGSANGSRGQHTVMAFSTDLWTAQQTKDIAALDQQPVSYIITTALREYFERRQKGQEVKSNGQDNWDERRAQ